MRLNARNEELLDEDAKVDDDRYMIGNPSHMQQIFSSSSSISPDPGSPSIPRDGESRQQSHYIQMMRQDQSQISLRSASINPLSVASAVPSEYNYDDYINSPQMDKTRYAKFNSNEPLPPPCKKGCKSKLTFYYETFFATRPRILTLWLLFGTLWPRFVACVDLYTDGQVAYQLYKSKQIEFFTLSFAFIFFPFVIVWATSLRFLQKLVNGLSKDQKWIRPFVLLYLFPPFGCIIVTTYEIVWIVYDVLRGTASFCRGSVAIIDKDTTTESVKSYL